MSTDEKLICRALTTSKLFGITHISEFDALKTATHWLYLGESKQALVARHLNMAIQALGINITRTRNQWGIESYKQKMEAAKNILNSCREAKATVPPVNDGNNGQTQITEPM